MDENKMVYKVNWMRVFKLMVKYHLTVEGV